MAAPRISLCMIVRDEAANLPRCLESAHPFVDEICLVDTGSADDTVRIARSFGATVEEIEWPDSFAEARNASLAMAQGEWILVLDADEALAPGAGERLAELVREDDVEGAFLEFHHHVDGETRIASLLRLFRNDPSHRYEGVIHEQIDEPVAVTAERAGRRLELSDVVVDHFGYGSAERAAKGKDARNLELFELAAERDPDNAYTWFKYADFLREAHPERALDAFERTCELIEAMDADERRRRSFCGEAYALHAVELTARGRDAEAGDLLERANATCEPTAHLLFATGNHLLGAGRCEEALDAFRRCHGLDGTAQVQRATRGVCGEHALVGIGHALLGLRRVDESIEHFLRASGAQPDSRVLAQHTARLLGDLGRAEEGLAGCVRWLESHPHDAGFWRLGGELLLEVGLLQEAVTFADRTAELEGGGGVDGAVLRGQCALARGDVERAGAELVDAGSDPIARAVTRLLAEVHGQASSEPAEEPAIALVLHRLQAASPELFGQPGAPV